MESRVPLTAVSLFSGAGGMDAGFRQAGFEIVLGADRNPDAASTYCLNHPETLFHFGDVLDSRINALTVDAPAVVFGGPPCQGFSVAGARDPRHPSNELIWSFVESVRLFRPLAFVMENVPGLLTVQNGRLLDEIVRAFESFDGRYNVQLEILNAVQFGVPQVRRRVFLVGTRPGIRYQFPRPSFFRGLYITVADAISDLPIEPTTSTGILRYPTPMGQSEYQRARRRGCHAVYNFNCKKLQPLRLSRIGHLNEGDNKRAIPSRLQPGGRDSKYRRLDSNQPSPTVTAHLAKDSSDFIHPWLPRPITVREAARLQSFDDRYKFCGSQAQQLAMVGNAVPPLLALAIAENLEQAIRDYKFERAVRMLVSLLPTMKSPPPASKLPKSRRSRKPRCCRLSKVSHLTKAS
jgi:DNA (cytosine-5)-methyltransferase 1